MIDHDLTRDPAVVALGDVQLQLRTFASGLVIKTADGYAAAAERLKTIKKALSDIEDARTRITKPLNDSLREVNAQARDAAAPFQSDETAIKAAMVTYSNEQDRLRREQQRIDNEKAENERKRLAEASERNAEKGNVAKSENFADRAATVVAPVSQAVTPKIGGIAYKTAWKYRIVDPAKIPRKFMTPDETKIRLQVAATKGETVIAGVEVYSEKTISSGRST